MPYTDVAVFSRLGEGAEANLILTAGSFPSQFEHTLIQNIVQCQDSTRCGIHTGTNLIDEVESGTGIA